MRKKQILATATGGLILTNVVAFVIGLAIIYTNPENIKYIAIQPDAILHGKYFWTFLTSMFMHSPISISHLLFNMITLLFIGSFVERLIGKKRFLWLYFIGGLLASLTFVLLSGFFGTTPLGAKIFSDPMTMAVGASGAIFALGGLLAVLTPKMKVLVMFIIPMPMWMAMIGLVFVLWAVSLGLPLGVGNTAHFGGLMVGVIYGAFLRTKYPHKTRMISRYFE
jgi:membrane associated rhomboid family serine protease